MPRTRLGPPRPTTTYSGVGPFLLKCSRSASAMARKVSKMSVLLDLPPMMNSTLVCLSQCLKQMRATSFIFS